MLAHELDVGRRLFGDTASGPLVGEEVLQPLMRVEVEILRENVGAVGLVDAPFRSQGPLCCERLRLSGSGVFALLLFGSINGKERHRQFRERVSFASDLVRLVVAEGSAVNLQIAVRLEALHDVVDNLRGNAWFGEITREMCVRVDHDASRAYLFRGDANLGYGLFCHIVWTEFIGLLDREKSDKRILDLSLVLASRKLAYESSDAGLVGDLVGELVGVDHHQPQRSPLDCQP